MGIVGLLKPVRDYIDNLVHPTAQCDALQAVRHRAFIAPRLLGSLAALAALPIYLAMRGMPGPLEILVFAWLVVPILIAYFLSRTGRYEGAHVLSSLALTGLVTVVAALTGGIASFAAIWLVLVPLEAALSASRRVVAAASTFALGAAGLLLGLGETGVLPDFSANPGALAALGVISATLFGTGLALGAESLTRASFWLLYAEEDRYRLLARNMTDVITRHGRNGAVLFASPAAESLFGAKVNELTGHGLFDRVHVVDRPAYLTALADAAISGAVRSVEFRIRRGGEHRAPERAMHFIWVEMRCRPLDRAARHEDGSEREVVAVMRDISERKVEQQALEMARAESERASLTKTRFLANMSHELRTPLNAIIGFSEMLSNEEPMRIDAGRRKEYALLINESGHHLLSMVNGILDMSKMETGDFEIVPEPFAPGPVVVKCCDILALRAREAGLELAVRINDDLPEIVADKRAFKQILLNLLSNAIKFTKSGGRIVVGAKAHATALLVTVEDNGVGIGTADMPRLGDPFFQARSAYDRRHDGTGLGLSIVKGLVALHGGEFKISSELGAGTRVTIRLPIDCETMRPKRPPIRIGSHLPTPMDANKNAATDGQVKKSA